MQKFLVDSKYRLEYIKTIDLSLLYSSVEIIKRSQNHEAYKRNNSINTLNNDFLGKATAKNPCYLYIALVKKYEKITMLCSSLSNLYTISIYLTASQTSLGQYLTNFLLSQVPISLRCFLGNQPPINQGNSSTRIMQSSQAFL